MANVCKTCGGSVSRIGNYYVCEYCANKWEIDSADDIHAVDRANAWSALRHGDFEKAAERFDLILEKEPRNHEAYWGRALALGGIVYVTDTREDKKVPTCNNITEASFSRCQDVQKAISLAPADVGDTYRKQADYIEKVRIEWLEKASKEPAYDVFISFKDSDRENGIERTQDSIDAQDLYNALVAEGYKVFFSRISLRDKISEQYEPYIYNAIKTAKVMIVFGEKPEYFSSVWIKNEWSRFRARIEKGEKHRNALVVVYKNMNPNDLPAVLKARQCMNAGDMIFLSDLNRHIKRVIEESRRNVQLEKIAIAGGQIAKKASALSVNAVQTRQIGAGAIAETSISEKQSISLLHTFLEEKQWHEAASLADDVLFNNPNCAEAIWCKLLARHHARRDADLIKRLEDFCEEDYGALEKVLNCSSRAFAEEILQLLYGAEEAVPDGAYRQLLETILPFSFAQRQACIRKAMDGVIGRSKYASFQLLLNTLNADEVDTYISYNYRYAVRTTGADQRNACLDNILKVDEGNVEALRLLVTLALQSGKTVEETTAVFENLLRYASNPSLEVQGVLDWFCRNLASQEQCLFVRQLLRYYTGQISDLKDPLIKLGYVMLSRGFFQEVEFFWNLILSFDPGCAEAYWGICLMKVRATTEDKIHNSTKLLRDVPEFNKYLTFVDDQRRRKCIELSKKQVQNYIATRHALEAEQWNLVTQVKKSNPGCIPASLIVFCAFAPLSVWAIVEDMTFLGSALLVLAIVCFLCFISSIRAASKKREEKREQRERIETIERLLADMPEIEQ